MIIDIPSPPEPQPTDLTPDDLMLKYGPPSLHNLSSGLHAWWIGRRYVEWFRGKLIDWERPEPTID